MLTGRPVLMWRPLQPRSGWFCSRISPHPALCPRWNVRSVVALACRTPGTWSRAHFQGSLRRANAISGSSDGPNRNCAMPMDLGRIRGPPPQFFGPLNAAALDPLSSPTPGSEAERFYGPHRGNVFRGAGRLRFRGTLTENAEYDGRACVERHGPRINQSFFCGTECVQKKTAGRFASRSRRTDSDIYRCPPPPWPPPPPPWNPPPPPPPWNPPPPPPS